MKIWPDILALVITVALAVTLLQGCAASSSPYAESANMPTTAEPGAATSGARPPTETPTRQQKSGIEVTGVWQGQSWAWCATITVDPSRCGAVNDITFTLMQQGATVTGFYKCSYGNMTCRNQNETGKVAKGSMGRSLLQMRVMLPDGSDCLFNGQPKGDAIEGGYICLQGGGMVERGNWRARRGY